ncbi:MAG TPA: hypothetical protein VGN42_17960 [Pirellulales bacterium]|jgi:hypothetical protein|nr:hypothetical protein [Pirellulales bacterium]
MNRVSDKLDKIDRFDLTTIERDFQNGGAISSAQCLWLLEECGRLTRASSGLDLAVRAREAELKAKDHDYTGLVSEWQDLADENRRLKQDLELARLQLNKRR